MPYVKDVLNEILTHQMMKKKQINGNQVLITELETCKWGINWMKSVNPKQEWTAWSQYRSIKYMIHQSKPFYSYMADIDKLYCHC